MEISEKRDSMSKTDLEDMLNLFTIEYNGELKFINDSSLNDTEEQIL